METVRHRRAQGRIYSSTFSPAGRLHYVSANENTIYMVRRILWFESSFPLLTHSTYIRDLAFDPGGSLYFSEASGAGGGGRIYRRDPGAAPVLWREVPLAAVGGFWSGDFALDARGDLYITSGNRIPASLYRCRDGAWTEVYAEADEPIKGLAFLATDLLAYANWRSEIYLLDLRDGHRELVYSNPARLWLSDVALNQPQIEEETLYEGVKVYTCDGTTCWRDDGAADDTWDFVDKDADSPQIAAMLADIGAPTTPTEDDAEIWSRTRTVWAWMQAHGLGPGDPNFAEAQAYRASLGHWPTVAEFAYMFATYGGFNWSDCTCMCRAQTFATLLYRAGIPVNRMAIAETRWKPSYSQHMYIVLQLDKRWFYVDPSANDPELPLSPTSIGFGGTADYTHPNSLTVIPGSTLTRPMLVR